MDTVQRETIVYQPVVEDSSSAIAGVAVILMLLFVAVAGFLIFAYNPFPTTVIERNTTIQTPAPSNIAAPANQAVAPVTPPVIFNSTENQNPAPDATGIETPATGNQAQ